MEKHILTITQLNTYISQVFASETLLHSINVEGEVTGYSISRNIAYFSIKDENSLLNCVAFKAEEKYIPKNGEKIIVTGSVSYYAKGGKMTFIVTKIEKYGLGELYKQYLELKSTLESEGLFDSSRKKLLPSKIKRVGVVTSKTGAVIQDIINVGFRRNNQIDIILYPVKVQGINAENEIASGIKFFDDYNVDVIIVARGGGSEEDLQPFNAEVVARAVSECKKVVVTGVGHETDFTIIDFVADLRTPTPSAAAELVFGDVLSESAKIKALMLRIINNINYQLNDKERLIQSLNQDMIHNTNNKINNTLNNFILIKSNFDSTIDKFIDNNEKRLNLLSTKLSSLDPQKILKLGYSVVRNKQKYIKNVDDVSINDDIDIILTDGIVSATVKGKEKKNV